MNHSNPVVAAPPSRFRTLGIDLDPAPEHFGFLNEVQRSTDSMPDLRQRMATDGYLFFRNFWPRETVQTVRDALTVQLERLGFLRPGFPRDEARAIPGREVGRAMGNPLDQHDPAVSELLFGETMMGYFSEFLGGPSLHLDYIWFRTKGTGHGSPLHCDLVYMGRGTHQLYTAWVPLGDVPLEMGGLLVLEGSHKKGEELQAYLARDVDAYCENHEDAAEFAAGRKWWDGTLSKNPRALQQSLGGRWLTAEEYRLGDVVIFNMTLVHGSLDNSTDRIRLSTDTRYQLASEPADERWLGDKPAGHVAAMKRGRIC